MNAEEKEQFITDLTNGIASHFLGKVKDLPEDWDGHELRQWMVDTWKREAIWRPMEGKRMKDYRNEVLVRNL